MPDSKKRLCPECDKEFEDNGEIGETPCCKFPIRSFDAITRINAASEKQRKAKEDEENKKKADEDAKKGKKKGGTLGNLGGLL